MSLDEIPEIEKYLNAILISDYKINLKISEINNTREPNITVAIETEEISQSTNTDNVSNYGFKANYTADTDELSILNFIVSEKYDGTMYSYITIYKPDLDWFESKKHLLDLNTFTGEVLYFNYDGSYVGTTFYIDGLQTTTVTRDPCDNDGDTSGGNGGGGPGDPGGPGGPGGSTGSAGGGGIGIPGDGGSIFCTCEGHDPTIEDCSCSTFIIITTTLNVDPIIYDLIQRGPCDGDVQGDPCERSQGNPCDNEDVSIIATRRDRGCEKLQELAQNPDFVQKINELSNATSGNTEKGYWGRLDANDQMEYSYGFEGESGEHEVTPDNPTGLTDTFIHNHWGPYSASLPFFSPGDLQTMYKLDDTGYMGDTSDFVMVVVTPGPTSSPNDDYIYAVTISSSMQFDSVKAVMASSEKYVSKLYDDNKNKIIQGLNIGHLEERFAKLIRNKKLGLNFYKGNINDLSDWTNIYVRNNGDLIEKNCND